MKTQNILLNSSHIVPNTNNSRLRYTFPLPQTFTNAEIAIHNIQMYYSWFNVNASLYNNNQFQYKWWNSSGNLSTIVTITIPDGFYTPSSLTLFLQNEMTKNTHYLVDNTSKKIFFIEFVENPVYYSIQINLSPMYSFSAGIPTGWTKPGTWKLPSVQATPVLTILSTNTFKDLIGFNDGSYPSVAQTTLYQKRSNYVPQINPVSSLIIRCNIAQNQNSLPNDVIYSFTSGDASFGGLINEKPNNPYFTSTVDGSFNSIELFINDQNFNPVQIIDPNMLITLVIKHN